MKVKTTKKNDVNHMKDKENETLSKIPKFEFVEVSKFWRKI